jgi:hypothetical protein
MKKLAHYLLPSILPSIICLLFINIFMCSDLNAQVLSYPLDQLLLENHSFEYSYTFGQPGVVLQSHWSERLHQYCLFCFKG